MVTTRVGNVVYGRPYFFDEVTRQGCYPMDVELGVPGQVSAEVEKQCAELVAHMPYEQAAKLYTKLTRVKRATTTIWESVQEAGPELQPALHPVTTGKSLDAEASCAAIALDGFMIHVCDEGYKECKIGAVFEANPCPDADADSGERVYASNQTYMMHLGGPEAIGVKLQAEAKSRKFEQAKQTAVIGDGAAWIWNIASVDYPDSAHIVDWYHAKQHLFASADVLFATESAERTAWVRTQSDLLFNGSALEIATRLLAHAQSAGRTPDTAALLTTEAGYFTTYAQHMQYADFRAAYLPIGSGVIESAAKQAKQRMSGPGMRWSRKGAENMLPLRSAVMSDSFDDIWQQRCP